ncbi:MAG: GNAT family N-acetyltransferase [Xanthobacteraceae bacterium]
MRYIELRDRCDDFEGVADLWRRVWGSYYGGRSWIVMPDATFFRWQLAPESGAMCHVAYDKAKLVGCVFSLPFLLRMDGSTHRTALVFGLTVDPEHRGLALPLVARLRRCNAERGISFALGLMTNDPASPSHVFWTKYGNAFPRNLRVLLPLDCWVKALAPQVVAHASIKHWERVAMRGLGPLFALTPCQHDPDVRPYRAADLQQCAEIVEQAAAAFDWAMVWSPQELSHRLDTPSGGTLVLDRGGGIRAVVNYHCIVMQGRARVLAAVIALWADDGLSAVERIKLLGYLCSHLREVGVHMVTAVRCAMLPSSAFWANLFMPTPGPWQLAAVINGAAPALAVPKRGGFPIM